MSEGWPAAMLISTAARYLDASRTEVERLIKAGHLGAVQYNERGDRRILKEEIDAYLYQLRQKRVVA